MESVNQKLSRRSLLASIGGAAALVVLAGCGGAAPAASAPTPAAAPATAPAAAAPAAAPTAAPTTAPAAAAQSQPSTAGVQLKVSVWGDVPDKATYDGITAAFNKVDPNISAVGDQYVGSGNDYYDKMQTALAGGTAPDLLHFQGWSWQAYADKGVLSTIDDYI